MTQSEKYYDKLASTYDQATSEEGRWTPPSYIFRRVKPYLTPDVDILDIGIGTGQSIEEIHCSKQFSTIQGVDVSQEMLDVCSEKYPDILLTKITCMKDLDILSRTFDIIVCSGALEFIEDIEVFFDQSSRLLGKKGRLFFTYEALIAFHPIQKDEKSLTVSGVDSSIFVEDFYTYRRTPYDIFRMLETHKLSYKGDEEFISYTKGGEKIIYHLVSAER